MNILSLVTSVLVLCLLFNTITISLEYSNSLFLTSFGQENRNFSQKGFSKEAIMPRIYDSNLHVELLVDGLETPTTMAFLGPNDILVLEKDTGRVQRIMNGTIVPEPLLDVNVATSVERGMCGIAISKNTAGHTYIFLYFTEAESADGEDRSDGKNPLGNRVYRYDFVNNKLVNPKLLLDLPADPGPRHNASAVAPGRHNGGVITIGPDNNLYIAVGDIDKSNAGQNIRDGSKPDGTGSILRITQDGRKVENILRGEYPLDFYYAYGIRNSFGMDFDPVTGKLWNTENGPSYGDEINLVEPGFNSGWLKVQGMARY